MHSTSQRLSVRAMVSAFSCGRVNAWTRRVTALTVMVVALAGGLAMAQDASPPGPPGPQGPPKAPSTTAAPSQPGAPGQPETPGIQRTINGDMAAWAEVEAAYKKLDALSGYREKVSGVNRHGSKFDRTDEIVPLKSLHRTTETQPAGDFPGGMSEEVVVGNQRRFRIMDTDKQWGPWECVKAAPVRKPGASMQETETVEVSRGPDTAIEGTPVRTYVLASVSTYTFSNPNLKPGTVTGRDTLYVDPQTGLLRREVFVVIAVAGSDKRDFPPTTTDYYDYDAKIDITLPPCEKEL